MHLNEKQTNDEFPKRKVSIHFVPLNENIPDTIRDYRAIGALENYNIKIMSSGKNYHVRDQDGTIELYTSMGKSEQDQMLASDTLPEDADILVMTYTQLGTLDSDKVNWFLRIMQNENLDISLNMDEFHKATGVNSNTGRTIQEAMDIRRKQGNAFNRHARKPRS